MDFLIFDRMLPRSESARRSLFGTTHRLSSPQGHFQYFGDDSELSNRASQKFKRSGYLLGEKLLQHHHKVPHHSIINRSSYNLNSKQVESPASTEYAMTESGVDRRRSTRRGEAKESQLSDSPSLQEESVGLLRGEIGELVGRVKQLENIISDLAVSEIKTRQEVSSIRRSVMCPERASKRASIPKRPSTPFLLENPSDQENVYPSPLTNSNKKGGKCGCGAEKEKEQMEGIIFELYQQNRFYQGHISKTGDLRKGSFAKNKDRMRELLSHLRNI